MGEADPSQGWVNPDNEEATGSCENITGSEAVGPCGQTMVPGNRFTSPHLDWLVADSGVRDALRQAVHFTSSRR